MQKYIKSSFCRFAPVFLLLLPAFASGQMLKSAGSEKLHFGITVGGACNSTFPSSGAWQFGPAQTKIGVTGGAFFQFDFAKRFFAYFELNVSGRRLAADGISSDTAYGDFKLSCHYTDINVPVGLGISFFPASSSFNASFLACATVGLPQENKKQITVNRQDIEKGILTVNVGVMAELRFKYDFVFLAFRYEFSGTDMFKYRRQAFKTGTFSFLLGFQII